MAKLSARNRSLVLRWFDAKRGRLLSLMSDGSLLARTPFSGWSVVRTWNSKGFTKTFESASEYIESVKAYVDKRAQPRGRFECRCQNAYAHATLRDWVKAGKPEPCPCPTVVRTLFVECYPTVTTLPSRNTLEAWSTDSVCESLDGCTVEPDGTCEHGSPSWLIALRAI